MKLPDMSDLLKDSEIPSVIIVDGKLWRLLNLMENFHYRALFLPFNGGDPRWFSNSELKHETSKST